MNIETERLEIEKLAHLINQVGVWLYAPPIREAQRRAALLRKLIDDNPERV